MYRKKLTYRSDTMLAINSLSSIKLAFEFPDLNARGHLRLTSTLFQCIPHLVIVACTKAEDRLNLTLNSSGVQLEIWTIIYSAKL